MAPQEGWFEVKLEVDGQVLDPSAFQLEESLSGVDRLGATVVAADEPLPPGADLIGKEATFFVRSASGTERHFRGFVESAVERSVTGTQALVLGMASDLERLALRRDCRIFQKLTLDAIVKKVLSEAGVPESSQSWKLADPHPEREYTVQYRETDLEFVQRLLAEEGVWYVHRFGPDAFELVFSDDPKGMGPIEGEAALPFLQQLGVEFEEEALYHVVQRHAVATDKVFVRDRDFEKPKVMLEAPHESTDPGAHALEHYEYPARVVDQGSAAAQAKNLLLSIAAERELVSVETASLRLLTGACFQIQDHPWTPLNKEILVVRSSVSGRDVRKSVDGASHELEAQSLRAAVEGFPTGRARCRPRRPEVARRIPGLQTAFTTGASGEEIHVDKHGRVKVHFHWDRLNPKDDTSSTWIRTSQVPLVGAMLLPRVGWEVSVVFSEGDPDRPYVMARYYNATAPPPYALPAAKASMAVQTATTPGGGSSNEFSMSDTKGKEGMLFNGSRDMSVGVGNNATESVKNNQSIAVGSNHSMSVSGAVTTTIGADETVTIGGNQTQSIGTLLVENSSTHAFTVGGNRNLSIGGDHRRTVSASSTLTVGGNSIDLVAGSVFESTLATMTHSVGAALVELCGGSRSVVVGGVRSETTGALKAIVAKKGRGLQAAAYSNQVGGAFVALVKGDRKDEAKAAYTDLAAGLQISKAKNVLIEAQAMLVVQMGAASLMLSPASVSVTGAAIKLDGATVDTGGIVMDN